MNKRGQLGLGLASNFIIAILIIATIVFAAIIAMDSLLGVSDSVMTRITGAERLNETTNTVVNFTSYQLSAGNESNIRNPQCTVTEVLNATDNVLLAPANYTVENCRIAYATTIDGIGNNTIWEVTYTWNYLRPDAASVLNDVSSGTANFFTNATTWFILLSVMIIILIISVVIIAVNRFGKL